MSSLSVMGAFALVALSGGASHAETSFSSSTMPASELSAVATAFASGAGISQANEQVYLDLFFRSNYGYCDARKVAQVWNTGILEAKAVIGGKIAGGLTHLIDADIASTGGSAPCIWDDLGLEYDHAVALAQQWGRSPWDAKAKAATMATEMGHKRFFESMGFVFDGMGGGAAGQTERYQQLFFRSDYGYCDALKVAQVWGTDVGGAKAVIGQKISDGITDLVDVDIRSTAGTVSCDWSETELSLDDAYALARFWGVPVGEAKQKAAGYTSQWGNREFLRRLGSVLGRG